MGVCGSKWCCSGCGCCKSKSDKPADQENIKDGSEQNPLKEISNTVPHTNGWTDSSRPASGTVIRDQSTPIDSRLSLKIEASTTALRPMHGAGNGVIFESPTGANENSNLLQLDDRRFDPNALNMTPMGNADPNGNGFEAKPKLESVAMFVPFETVPGPKRASRSNRSDSSRGSASSTRKGKRAKSRYKDAAASAKRSSDSQSFIPGTGTEKMLLDKKKPALAPLKPIKSIKKEAKANDALRRSISKDKRSRANIVTRLDRFLGTNNGFDAGICELIRAYAEIADTPQAVEFELVEKDKGPSSIKPDKAPAPRHPSGLPMPKNSMPLVDPFAKKKLLM